MNQLQVFNFVGNEIRVVTKDGQPWWVAKDVAEVLGFDSAYRVVRLLDEDEKDAHNMVTPGGPQSFGIINESGLYSAIMKSRKPEARQFKRWVTHEVLPSIRKHGAYMTEQTIEKALTSPDFLIDLATRLKEEQQARLAAESTVKQQQPLVQFAETCMSSKNSIRVREMAKLASKNGINIGQNRLFAKLREWGLIMHGSNEPMQRAIDAGWFEVVQGVYQRNSGAETYRTPRVTPKGQVYIIKRLKEESA